MTLVVNARFLTQPLTGVQRYAIECSIQIKQISNNVVFVCPPGILHPEIAQQLDAKIIGRHKGHYWEQVELYRFLKRSGNPPLLCLGNTAPFRYNNNYITIHDLAFMHHPEWNLGLFARWYRLLVPALAGRARHIFTVSETIKDEIVACLNITPGKISITYNGLPSLFFQYHPVEKQRQILSVGSFNRRKNHHLLIQAFIESGLGDDYSLIIAGSADDIFRETGFDNDMIRKHRIKIINRPNDDELIKLYQASEVVVSLSAYEGFGIPVLEGIYFRCKVLCSDIAVYRELFNNYVYFCRPDNIESIRNSLAEITRPHIPIPSADAEFLSKYNYVTSAEQILNKINYT